MKHKKHIKLLIAIIIALSMCCHQAFAKAHTVTPATQEIPKALPGDTILFKPGVYTGSFIVKSLIGTKEKPIIIRPEKPGKVLFRGDEQVKLAWRKQGNVYTAKSTVPPHNLYRNGNFMLHAKRKKLIKPGMYHVEGKGPWHITYQSRTPITGKDVFTRGARGIAFRFKRCAHLVVEGFRFKNYGLYKLPHKSFGMTNYFGNVLRLVNCESLTVRNMEIDGWIGRAVAAFRCNRTLFEKLRIKNGYGMGVSVAANGIGAPTEFFMDNVIRDCEFSHIYQYHRAQIDPFVEAIGINGVLLFNTVVEGCFFHHLSGPATGVHFDVRTGHSTVRNCIFYKNGSNGGGRDLFLENRIHHVTIENNVFANTTRKYTIELARCWDIDILNNTFYMAGRYNLELEAVYNFKIEDNIFTEPTVAAMLISEQTLKKEKVDRGLQVSDGHRLYDLIKSRSQNIRIEEIDKQLKWAGVAPLNDDGSKPDHISWQNDEDLKARGIRAISARRNPHSNGIDIEPVKETINVIKQNIWHTPKGSAFAIYTAPDKRMANTKAISFAELKKLNPTWGAEASMTNPDYANPAKGDFRVKSLVARGADARTLAEAMKLISQVTESVSEKR